MESNSLLMRVLNTVAIVLLALTGVIEVAGLLASSLASSSPVVGHAGDELEAEQCDQ